MASLSGLPRRPLHIVEIDGLQCRCLWARSSTKTVFPSLCTTKAKHNTVEISRLPQAYRCDNLADFDIFRIFVWVTSIVLGVKLAAEASVISTWVGLQSHVIPSRY